MTRGSLGSTERLAESRTATDEQIREAALAIRAAVIGLGEAGAGIHLPALQGMRTVAAVGACDTDIQRRTSAAADGLPVFATHEELLLETRPDLVIVASPPEMHVTHCLAALDAGADVLCEKPLAASVREGEQLLARARELNRRVAVNHEFRAMPIFERLLAGVAADDPGVPVFVQAWQVIHADPAGEAGWRGQLRHRTLYEAGVHLVDLVLALFGGPPVAVRASMASAGGSGASLDPFVVVTLEFSHNRLAQIIQSRRHRGDRQYLEIRADTETASYRSSFGGRARLSFGLERSARPHVRLERGASGMAWRERGTVREVIARNPRAPLVAATRTVLEECVEAVESGGPLSFSAEHGVHALQTIAAAYLAAETGRTIALDGPDADAISTMRLGAESSP